VDTMVAVVLIALVSAPLVAEDPPWSASVPAFLVAMQVLAPWRHGVGKLAGDLVLEPTARKLYRYFTSYMMGLR
jgi:hypothetical protein